MCVCVCVCVCVYVGGVGGGAEIRIHCDIAGLQLRSRVEGRPSVHVRIGWGGHSGWQTTARPAPWAAARPTWSARFVQQRQSQRPAPQRSRRQVVRAGVHGASVRNIGRQSCGACACDLSGAWRSFTCDPAAAFLRCCLAHPPSMFVVVVHGVHARRTGFIGTAACAWLPGWWGRWGWSRCCGVARVSRHRDVRSSGTSCRGRFECTSVEGG